MNTDNPQQTVSDLELGWLAGIIEGEGSICLILAKQKSSRIGGVPLRVDPRIIITNTDKAIIEKCVDILDRLGVGKWVSHSKPNNEKYRAEALVKKHHKDITYIFIQGFKRVHRMLGIISRAMYGDKKRRCEVLVRFLSKRLEGGRGVMYDEKEVELMLEFLRLTSSKNYDKIAGMLNEHTRDARRGPRSEAWHKKRRAGIERSQRCALDSRESVRADGNDQPPL